MAPTYITNGLGTKLESILTLLGLNMEDYYNQLNITTANTTHELNNGITATLYHDPTHKTNISYYHQPPEDVLGRTQINTEKSITKTNNQNRMVQATVTYTDSTLSTLQPTIEDVLTHPGLTSTTSTFTSSWTSSASTPHHHEVPTDHTHSTPSTVFNTISPAPFNISSCYVGINRTSVEMYTYGIIFLAIAALLLNGLQVIIFYSPSLRKYAFSLYFRFLAIVDIISLFGYVPRRWITIIYLMLDWDPSTTLYRHSSIACKSIEFISSTSRFISAWLVVLMICERLNAVYNPYKSHGIVTARKAIACCVTIALIYNGHLLFTWDIITTENEQQRGNNRSLLHTICAATTESHILSLIYTTMGLGGINVVPLFIAIVLTLRVYRGLNLWKIRSRRMTQVMLCRAVLEKRATVMVCGVTTLYCVLSVPYVFTSLIVILQTFVWRISKCTHIYTDAFVDITEFMFLINFAAKFLVCILLGNKLLNYKL